MVHFAGPSSWRTEAMPSSIEMWLRTEVDDAFEDDRGHTNKRMKHSPYPDHQMTSGNNASFMVSHSRYNPVDKPGPLGLRLQKSPSFLELIRMKLSQGNSNNLVHGAGHGDNVKGGAGIAEKLKAANFPASKIKIGGWEYASRYEGDLVGKCYFAKRKLVWEILDGGLKSKLEMQWSDIMGLKADIPEDGPATLTVALARQPLFFRETNPQPRKHTLWQATADFTDGHASLHRQHFLLVPYGLLNKHFEKLIQCDAHLNFLSQQPEMVLDCPYFNMQGPDMSHSDEAERPPSDPGEFNKGSSISPSQDDASPTLSQSSCITFKQEDIISREAGNVSHEAPSPSSFMGTSATEVTGSVSVNPKSWEQLLGQGLHPSMSMTNIVNHVGSCISEQASCQSPSVAGEGSDSREILDDLTDYLLSDSQSTVCPDDKILMASINSLCCLVQGTVSAKGTQLSGDSSSFLEPEEVIDPPCSFHTTGQLAHHNAARLDGAFFGGNAHDFPCKPAPTISRTDSFGELMLHLPRVPSLPDF